MKKLKNQHITVLRYSHWRKECYKHYPNLRNQYFRHIRTTQEKAMFFLHFAEYGVVYQGCRIKMRAKRGKGLPCNWDDLPTHHYKYAKSWKHNSKCKHQWYLQ